MLFILYLIFLLEHKGTNNPAHFSNEREKVSVNDSKEKKSQTHNVRKFEYSQRSRVKIFTLNFKIVQFYQLFTNLVPLVISEIPHS